MILTKTTKDWEKTIYKYLPEKIDDFHVGMDILADCVFSSCGLDKKIKNPDELEEFLEEKWRSGNACETVGGYGYDFCVFEFEWGDEEFVAFMASSGDYFRGVHVWMICDEWSKDGVLDRIVEQGETYVLHNDIGLIRRNPFEECGCFDITANDDSVELFNVYVDCGMCEEDHYDKFWVKVEQIMKEEKKRLEEINARKDSTTERN